jgi:uncharacterized membrane protein
MSEPLPQAIHFDATLLPHRSLPREGFHALIAALVAANLVLGVPMFLLGAWPVVGFMGLDIALVVFLFRLNYRSGRLSETLRLTDTELVVTRVDPEGVVEETRLEAAWLRAEMDDPPEHESRLTLISRGNRLVVGRFLTPDERLEVAQALRAAVRRLKSPTYARRLDQL